MPEVLVFMDLMSDHQREELWLDPDQQDAFSQCCSLIISDAVKKEVLDNYISIIARRIPTALSVTINIQKWYSSEVQIWSITVWFSADLVKEHNGMIFSRFGYYWSHFNNAVVQQFYKKECVASKSAPHMVLQNASQQQAGDPSKMFHPCKPHLFPAGLDLKARQPTEFRPLRLLKVSRGCGVEVIDLATSLQLHVLN